MRDFFAPQANHFSDGVLTESLNSNTSYYFWFELEGQTPNWQEGLSWNCCCWFSWTRFSQWELLILNTRVGSYCKYDSKTACFQLIHCFAGADDVMLRWHHSCSVKLTDSTKVVPDLVHHSLKNCKNVERPFSASFKYFLMKISGSTGMDLKRSNPGCFCSNPIFGGTLSYLGGYPGVFLGISISVKNCSGNRG